MLMPRSFSLLTNETPAASRAACIAAKLFRVGTRRTASKSLTVETPTLAAFASAS